MPAGDGTEAMGMGPMTGRGTGYCGGYDAPGWANPTPGRSLGLGWGRKSAWDGRGDQGGGWCHRNWFYAIGVPDQIRFGYGSGLDYGPYAITPNREQKTKFLRGQVERLKQQWQS
ncbi:MAG: DUF5320 domain-containing protein [Anaerolineae bacterium]|nr:DUF5320 domain-containing protein [Anaerolineae bacterium]